MQACAVPILFCDLTGRITLVNKAFERLAHCSCDHACGRSVDLFIKKESGPNLADLINSEKKIIGMPGHLIPQREHDEPVALKISANRTALGSKKNFNIMITLENVQDLVLAREKTKQAEQAKNRFLSNISHEVRTPLNHIMGMVDLLLNTGLDDEQKDYIDILSKSSDHLMTILSDMLDYTKLTTGNMSCDFIDFDLRLLLDNINEQIAPKAFQKKIDFKVAIHQLVPSLLTGDPGRLKKILGLLCRNAVKFTDQGRIDLSVFVETKHNQKVGLRFEIKDTGVGIAEKDISTVFNLFSQLDDSTTRRQGGTGLGLALAGKLVNILGGSMGVDSQLSKGSCFWFSLEFTKQSNDLIQHPINQKAISGKQMIVAVPQSRDRQIFTRLMTGWGGICRSAKNSQEAIQLIKDAQTAKQSFDLVLMDPELDETGGESLARQIKEMTGSLSPVMIMVTSIAQPGDVERLEQFGVKVYLPKPVRAQELYQSILTVLSPGCPQGMITRHTLKENKKRMVDILAVGAGRATQKMALHILSNAGYKVKSVDCNGATTQVESLLSPLILLFVDSHERAKKLVLHLKNIEKTKPSARIRIIGISNFVQNQHQRPAWMNQMDDHLVKPVSSKALLDAVEKQTTRVYPVDYSSQLYSNRQKVFNYETALDCAMGDKEFLKVLATEFIGSLADRLLALNQAVDKKQVDTIITIAQSLRGISGNIGADAIFSLTKAIEKAGEQGDLTQIQGLVLPLQKEVHRFKEYLTHFNWGNT